MLLPLILLVLQTQTAAPVQVRPVEGDYVIRNFRFTSGDVLPELRMHYRTYGTPQKDSQGIVRNAVLIMHGTGADLCRGAVRAGPAARRVEVLHHSSG
jgi:homoserine O-acetyltransferase